MILLDTDHLNYLQIGRGSSYEILVKRMDASPDQHFLTTVVTFEEHMRGWLASVRRSHDIRRQIRPYQQLVNLVRFFQAWEILPVGRDAAERFEQFRQQRIRIGSQDLKIACVALEYGAKLLTANTRDFVQIPGLNVEDWLH